MTRIPCTLYHPIVNSFDPDSRKTLQSQEGGSQLHSLSTSLGPFLCRKACQFLIWLSYMLPRRIQVPKGYLLAQTVTTCYIGTWSSMGFLKNPDHRISRPPWEPPIHQWGLGRALSMFNPIDLSVVSWLLWRERMGRDPMSRTSALSGREAHERPFQEPS